MKNSEEVFRDIYLDGFWMHGENVSASGAGSELSQTETLRRELPHTFETLGIDTVVDFPCGDMNWQIDMIPMLNLYSYKGFDIVPELVANNTDDLKTWHFAEQYPKVSFEVGDIVTTPIPKCDLLIVRDCFVHLPQSEILAALKNIAASQIDFVAITNFMGVGRLNIDIEVGEWRPVNLCEYPYAMPFPMHVIVENCTEGDGVFADKTLSFWSIEQVRQWLSKRI
jgi:hypothetical protein